MWRDMVLMDEHTWTSHDSVNDPTSDETAVQSAVKKRYAVDASSIADFVAKNSMASLADSISAARGSLDRLQHAELEAQRACDLRPAAW